MLLFDPGSLYLKWCRMNKGKTEEGKCILGKNCMDAVSEKLGDIKDVRKIGYILYHGGEEIKSPVSRLTEKNIFDFEKCIKYNPELNDITFKTAKYWMKRIPEAKHFLFCDTAFFLKLPQEACTYAIPYELSRKGVKRYGGYGLLHQWVYKKTELLNKCGIHRLISVYLGNNTNIAAIRNNRPLDTSIGFTPTEGIMSSGGCGDIDPTIIFNLNSEGLAFNEINKLLSQESGFSAFLGKNANFFDVIKNKDKGPAADVKEVFSYSIIKYIGAFFAELGGVDSIVFSSENLWAAGSFILGIINKLQFLGVKCKLKEGGQKDFFKISEPNSKIKVYCFNYKKWNILNQNFF
jgi:acetate kinase